MKLVKSWKSMAIIDSESVFRDFGPSAPLFNKVLLGYICIRVRKQRTALEKNMCLNNFWTKCQDGSNLLDIRSSTNEKLEVE